jgi:lipopolysaccharide transport system ATP-binding protein
VAVEGPAIEVRELGKQYRIGGPRQPYKTLRETLTDLAPRNLLRWRHRKGKPTFWALRELSFDVTAGEVVGIIGRNGAGKSTLLKILSSITEPTEGRAVLRGRVGSLLEVGTGFHPELSGRENIYLNGAILGMKRREIAAKFDQIVAFAEVERFIDTPVKHYSSGMYLRLAFALAAHLEPEILLVDEVLAVGDASFQQKCLGKMGEVASTGRTVLFVSHNMGAVRRLCGHGILLEEGRLVTRGPIDEVIRRYTEDIRDTRSEVTFPENEECAMQILGARLLDHRGRPSAELDRMHPFQLEVTYAVRRPLRGAHLAVMLDQADGTPVCHSADVDAAHEGIVDRKVGRYRTLIEYPGGLLNAGFYKLRVSSGRYGGPIYDHREAFVFTLADLGTFAAMGAQGRQRPGVLSLPLEWRTEEL